MLRIGFFKFLGAALFLFLLLPHLSKAVDFKSEVNKAIALLKEDRVECKEFTKQLLERSKAESNTYGSVKANFILGFIEKGNGDYGKAVIYYLEGIRHAELATYDGVSRDLIYLFQNTGNIFKKFGNYDLAKNYYGQAMDVASAKEDYQKYTYLVLLSAKVLKEEGKYIEASNLLKTTFTDFHHLEKETVADIYNQLGLIHTESHSKLEALENFEKLIQYVQNEPSLKEDYSGRAYHNIGNLHFEFGDFTSAITHYLKASKFKEEADRPGESLFITYKDLAEAFMFTGEYDSAELFIDKAEQYYNEAKEIPEYYELFKFKSQIRKWKMDLEGYSQYQELYASSLENYLAEQRQIEAADKKYNLDLITQRYFALVAEQERNQQIQYYSAVGGSFLVTLIVLIIAFYQYRKYRLRKDLEASLKPYIKDAL